MRFECTIFFQGDDHQVSANCYEDRDGIGRRWVAVEDIEGPTLPTLTDAMRRDVEELIADEYKTQPDPRD